jgi:antitoxin MazE
MRIFIGNSQVATSGFRLPQGAAGVYTLAIRHPGVQMSVQNILKWGNSLALRIPSAIAKQMRVSAGERVEIRLEGSRLVIEAAGEELPRFTRSDLLRALKTTKAREDNLGKPRGRELL